MKPHGKASSSKPPRKASSKLQEKTSAKSSTKGSDESACNSYQPTALSVMAFDGACESVCTQEPKCQLQCKPAFGDKKKSKKSAGTAETSQKQGPAHLEEKKQIVRMKETQVAAPFANSKA